MVRRISSDKLDTILMAPMRSREFYESVFKAMSRLTRDGDEKIAICLPARFRMGIPQRRRNMEVAWEKLGMCFDNLYIWFVDIDSSEIEKLTWNEVGV